MEWLVGLAVLVVIGLFIESWEKVSKEQDELRLQKEKERQLKEQAKLQQKIDHPYYELLKKFLILWTIIAVFALLGFWASKF